MDQIYKMLLDMDIRVKQYADDRSNPALQRLWQQVKQAGEEAQMKRGPQTIDQRMKAIQSALNQAEHQKLFSPGEVDDLYDRSQDIRDRLRDFM